MTSPSQEKQAVRSYTWELPVDDDCRCYLIVRDVLRFLGNADWEPGTVI